MKFGLMLVILLASQLSFSQTIREKKVKEEMLGRVDTLIQFVEEGQEALKKEEMSEVCGRIEDLFKLLPDHLVAIGTRMNLFDPKVIKMEHETKSTLIEMHQHKNICHSSNVVGENLDLKKTKKKFKEMLSMFEKQKKRIKKSDTGYENTYNYWYEFH